MLESQFSSLPFSPLVTFHPSTRNDMSCCCANPAQALIGATVFTLIVFIPAGFYELVAIVFRKSLSFEKTTCTADFLASTDFDEVQHQSLSTLSTITCVGAVVLAILALIGRVTKSTGVLSSTFWLGLVSRLSILQSSPPSLMTSLDAVLDRVRRSDDDLRSHCSSSG